MKIERGGTAPSVSTNPLPNHDTGRSDNANIVGLVDEDLVYEVKQLALYFEEIFEFAMNEGYLSYKVLNSDSS